MRASPSVFLFLLLASAAAFPQVDDREIIGVVVPREQQEARSRVELSKSRSNYPVTPGDVYALTYRSAGKEIAGDVLVENDYTLNLNIFGKINGKGLSFPELKARVESMISHAYPNGLPYLTLSSVGMFQVYLTGEVPQTSFVTAWGLTRLSEIVLKNLSPYSSTREVELIAADGRRKTYDLFKALQRGVIEEDPFIRPGDTIVLHRRGKEIELQGEVARPGKYQLLATDDIKDVIENYGGGFTIKADRSRVRRLNVGAETLKALHLDLEEGFSSGDGLQDGDVLSVPSKIARLPVVVFEGAVTPPAPAAPQAATAAPGAAAAAIEGYSQFTHAYAAGDTLYDALLSVRDSLQPTADLAGSYLVRQHANQTIPINLDSLLYRYDPQDDLELMPGDRVVIPQLRYYVAVIGAVQNPQSYEYVPQRTYQYYLTLAGGIPFGADTSNISIVDANGEPRPLQAMIQPEDRIIVTETLIPVVGAVYTPGTYPFVPGKTYSHYLNLAGGINPEINSGNRVSIRNLMGKRVKPSQAIQPGDRIYVRANDFLYNFNRYFPLISSTLALFTATLTLVDYFTP